MSLNTAPTRRANMEISIPVGPDFDATKHFDAILSVTKYLDEQSHGFRKQLAGAMHIEAGKLSDYSQCCAAHNLANQAFADTSPAFHLSTQVQEGVAFGLMDGEKRLLMTITPREPANLIGANPELFAEARTKENSWVRSFMNRVVEGVSAVGSRLFGRDTKPIDRAPSVGWTNAMTTFLPGAMEKWVKNQGFDADRVVALVRSKGTMFAQLDNLTGAAKKSEQVAGVELVGVAEMLARRKASGIAVAWKAPEAPSSRAKLG